MKCPHCHQEHEDGTVRCPATGKDITVMVMPVGGTVGGKYELVRLIGEGGMGSVYEARHMEIHQRVAVKILHSEFARDEEIRKRFTREALASGEIGHENIVEMHDIGTEQGGRVYLVMELLKGESLAERLKRVGSLSAEQSADILLQVLSALDASHGKGIVHRDMKPENVFLCRLGGMDSFVKVLDFGIAKVRDAGGETLTRSGAVLGTGQYMSPEQIMGDRTADHRIDVYACGVMLYRMLTGHLPFEAPSMQGVIYKTINEPPAPLASHVKDLPTGIDDVVMKALAKDRAGRYQSAADMARALTPFGSGRIEFGRRSLQPAESTPSLRPAGPAEPAKAAHAAPPRSGSHRAPASEKTSTLALLAVLPTLVIGVPAVATALVVLVLRATGVIAAGTSTGPDVVPDAAAVATVVPDAGTAPDVAAEAAADTVHVEPATAQPAPVKKAAAKKPACDPRKNPKCARIK